jgi:hypothetical protein
MMMVSVSFFKNDCSNCPRLAFSQREVLLLNPINLKIKYIPLAGSEAAAIV